MTDPTSTTSNALSYPSLQGSWSFDDVATAVKVLDEMVLRLKLMENAQRAAITKLENLPVKRAGRLQRDHLVQDLKCEADKTNDSLRVYGFYSRRTA